jgi:hypothetical protein
MLYEDNKPTFILPIHIILENMTPFCFMVEDVESFDETSSLVYRQRDMVVPRSASY